MSITVPIIVLKTKKFAHRYVKLDTNFTRKINFSKIFCQQITISSEISSLVGTDIILNPNTPHIL